MSKKKKNSQPGSRPESKAAKKVVSSGAEKEKSPDRAPATLQRPPPTPRSPRPLSASKEDPLGEAEAQREGHGLLIGILIGIFVGILWGVFAPTLPRRAEKVVRHVEPELPRAERQLAALQPGALGYEDALKRRDSLREALDVSRRYLALDQTLQQDKARLDALANKESGAAQEIRDRLTQTEIELASLRKTLKPIVRRYDVVVGVIGEAFRMFGEIFLKLLKMLIVPLVMASMICGVAFLGDIRKIGRLGGVAVSYYMITTLMAVLLGIFLVTAIRPGVGYPLDPDMAKTAAAEKLAVRGDYDFAQAFEDIMMGFFTENIIESMVEMQILPLIIFSIAFGAILTTYAGGKKLISAFEALNEGILRFVRLIMYAAPIGIAGLVGAKLQGAQESGAFFEALASLGWYAATVILGLLLHGFVVLPTLLLIFARRNPAAFIAALGKPLLTAFGTASSSATLPATIEALEDNAKVSKRTAGFVAPLGATINMDGTALYEAVAAIFIAQAYQIPLGPVHLGVIFVTATLAAIGAAGIPEAGLVTMILVLKAAGLPAEGIGLILAIDWFLDRCRTTINVWGDMIGAAIVDRMVPPGADEIAAEAEADAMAVPAD
jgi:solute carrier family 1 (high affinity glutamate transporter) protein 1